MGVASVLHNSYIVLMPSAAIRRQAALDAIATVAAGARAADAETDIVDFKEEAGTVQGGTPTTIPSQHEPAAVALAREVACFANTRDGGVLVVGVRDSEAGPAAFVGAQLDAVWLRRRIWALTSPHFSIDEVEEVHEQGVRLYLINVPPAIEEIRSGDRLRMRRGTECVEVSGDDARRLLEERRGFDWTAEPSGLRLSDADPFAMASAQRHYRERSGTNLGLRELVSRMGVTVDDADDPELDRAGALLLASFEPGIHQVELLITDSEGVRARSHLLAGAPVLTALDEVFARLDSVAFPIRTPTIRGLVRREARAVPEAAYREAIVNAVMHRDYQLSRMTIVAIASGAPTSTAIKVRSPGGLPPGVSVDRLLVTPSRPRNEAMAQALRVLGIAERQGVGIATMYRTMVRDGHGYPEIEEEGGDVVVRLAGGEPDLGLRAYLDGLDAQDPGITDDVASVIAVRELLTATPLRPRQLADKAQRTEREAREALDRLEGIGAVERLLNRSLSFRLSDRAAEALGSRVSTRRSTLDHQADLIRAHLDVYPDIGRDEVASILRVSHDNATRVLGKLRTRGDLVLTGPSRGRSVRYRWARR